MLYICLPSHNESATVGVLLWRIRQVFQEYSREYEVLVYDDASTDATRETLEPYKKVMPLEVIGGSARVGYAGAVHALLRAASAKTRYPRRDAVALMQADLTEGPDQLPEFVKRFEGGADLVLSDRARAESPPEPLRKLHRNLSWAKRSWPLNAFVGVPGVADPFATLRLIRLTVVRDVLAAREARRWQPELDTATASANAELTREVLAHARRTESVPTRERWDLRLRETRTDAWRDAVKVVKRAWATRRTMPAPRKRG